MKKLLFLAVVIFAASCGGKGGGEQKTEEPHQDILDLEFNFSMGFDENGMWRGVDALGLVGEISLPLTVPTRFSEVTDDVLEQYIERYMREFIEERRVYDRPVVNGDRVNIDFVGSIGGVEFEGGNTDGTGYYVVAGSNAFIGDFLHQIIGASPGDVVDVRVTFPDNYQPAELAGQPALFVTTVNYIIDDIVPVFDDLFVYSNFNHLGISTAEEKREELHNELRWGTVFNNLAEIIADAIPLPEIPQSIIDYFELMLIDEYKYYAELEGVTARDYIENIHGGVEEMLEFHRPYTNTNAAYALIVQAIAERIELVVDEDDIIDYFLRNMGTPNYFLYESMYGRPFLLNIAMQSIVAEYLMEWIVYD
jgi:trigger factor